MGLAPPHQAKKAEASGHERLALPLGGSRYLRDVSPGLWLFPKSFLYMPESLGTGRTEKTGGQEGQELAGKPQVRP